MDDIKKIIQKQGLVKVSKEKDSPYRKVAKFLFLIGSNEASKVIKTLDGEQVDKIVKELLTIQRIDKDEAEAILKEFSHLYDSSKFSFGGKDVATSMLEKAFGSERAKQIIDSSISEKKTPNFDYLKGIDAKNLSLLLAGELPSTQALILSQLPAKQVAEYISASDEKKEIIKAMLNIKSISSEILFEVSEAMKRKMSKIKTEELPIDGKASLLNILRTLDYKKGEELLETIEVEDEALAKELKDGLLTLEDVLSIPDFQMQKFLFAFDDDFLMRLIHAKNDAFRRKILSNLSEGRANRVEEEERLQDFFLKKDVRDATNTFMQKLLEANAKGDVEVIRGEKGEWV